MGATLSTNRVSAILCLAALLLPGCVRRTVRFTSEPSRATVFLNDREVGQTPVTVDFTWYGDYDVVYRLENHQTVKTHACLRKPIYQVFPLDFFAEILWPFEIHDHHEIPVQTLNPSPAVDEAELTKRALDLRNQALSESSPPTTTTQSTQPK